MIYSLDIGDAYAAFAFLASLCSLWAMQKVTPDASLSTWIGKVKWCHRGSIALASFAFMLSAAYTLYYDTNPRAVDFLLIFVLLAVLVLSVMRHIQAPVTGQRRTFFYRS